MSFTVECAYIYFPKLFLWRLVYRYACPGFCEVSSAIRDCRDKVLWFSILLIRGRQHIFFFFSCRLSYQKVKFCISTLPYKRQMFLNKTETKGSAFCLFLFSGVLSVLQTWVPKRGSFCCCWVDFFIRMHFDGRNWRWQDFFSLCVHTCFLFLLKLFHSLYFFCVNL